MSAAHRVFVCIDIYLEFHRDLIYWSLNQSGGLTNQPEPESLNVINTDSILIHL